MHICNFFYFLWWMCFYFFFIFYFFTDGCEVHHTAMMAGYLSTFLRLFLYADYKDKLNEELGRPIFQQPPQQTSSLHWILKAMLLIIILTVFLIFRRQIFRRTTNILLHCANILSKVPGVQTVSRTLTKYVEAGLKIACKLTKKLRLLEAVSYGRNSRIVVMLLNQIKSFRTFLREELVAQLNTRRRAVTRYMKRARKSLGARKRYVRIHPAVDLNATALDT